MRRNKNNEKLKSKSRLVKILLPFWIMKSLTDSSIGIAIVPKKLRKNTRFHLNTFIDFCFISVLKIFKNLLPFRYFISLRTYLPLKFIKIAQIIVQKKIPSTKPRQVKKTCLYENMIFKNIISPKIKTFNWKKNHTN